METNKNSEDKNLRNNNNSERMKKILEEQKSEEKEIHKKLFHKVQK